jgi:hypothetical protein
MQSDGRWLRSPNRPPWGLKPRAISPGRSTRYDMLAELRDDNAQLVGYLRETHNTCDEHGDVATASLLENWIDEAERRVWYLFEATRAGEAPGR